MKNIESQVFTPISLSSSGIKAALNEHIALISEVQTGYPFSKDSSNNVEVVPNIFVDIGLLNKVTDKYLNTTIENMTVYAVHNKLYFGLPCNGINFIISGQSEQTMVIHDDMRYYKINFNSEKTIAQLYQNAWMYSFDYEELIYKKLEYASALQQLIKPILAKRLFRYFGHSEDRLADYGRIILFLLSKVELNEDELRVFSPLLEYAPTISSIQPIITRETQLQKEVSEVKKDPIKFINLF